MNAQEMRMFSDVCKGLEENFLRLAETGDTQMPFDPIEVAEALSAVAEDFLPGPMAVQTI